MTAPSVVPAGEAVTRDPEPSVPEASDAAASSPAITRAGSATARHAACSGGESRSFTPAVTAPSFAAAAYATT